MPNHIHDELSPVLCSSDNLAKVSYCRNSRHLTGVIPTYCTNLSSRFPYATPLRPWGTAQVAHSGTEAAPGCALRLRTVNPVQRSNGPVVKEFHGMLFHIFIWFIQIHILGRTFSVGRGSIAEPTSKVTPLSHGFTTKTKLGNPSLDFLERCSLHFKGLGHSPLILRLDQVVGLQ